MRTKSQDPKFDIEDGRIINAASGKPIPENEPIFILRAKDIHAIKTLEFYLQQCANDHHRDVVTERIGHFESFAQCEAAQLKEPDTGS